MEKVKRFRGKLGKELISKILCNITRRRSNCEPFSIRSKKMAIKKFRPITPARRFMSVIDSSDITSKPTVRSLLVRVKAAAGRNNNGRITSRHKEAGAKNYTELLISKEINLE